jgi:hypothetical protein
VIYFINSTSNDEEIINRVYALLIFTRNGLEKYLNYVTFNHFIAYNTIASSLILHNTWLGRLTLVALNRNSEKRFCICWSDEFEMHCLAIFLRLQVLLEVVANWHFCLEKPLFELSGIISVLQSWRT